MNWKSVQDEMPAEDGKYLCHFSDGDIETFTWSGDGYENDPWGVMEVWVTHWMEIPDPPK